MENFFHTSRYWLMNKDVPAAEFTCMRDEFQDVEFSVEKIDGNLPIGFSGVAEWIGNRRAPSNRRHIEKLLTLCGCNDLEGFIQVTHAASLNDTFWVRAEDSELLWKDVSLFQNDFDESIARIAFEGGMYGEQFSTASPEFSTDGSFAKCWVRDEGQIFLLKRGSEGASNAGLEPYSEMYASQLAAVFCKDYVPYEVVDYRGKLASKCPLFTNEKEGYAPVYRCMDKNAGIARMLRFFSDIGSEEAFRRMLVFDALCVNTDRHRGNYGVIFDADTLKPLRMAPVFDHNQALLPYAVASDFCDIENYLSEKTPRIGSGFIETAGMMLTPEIRSDLRNLQDFRFCRDTAWHFPEKRLAELEKLVARQAERILKEKKFYVGKKTLDG